MKKSTDFFRILIAECKQEVSTFNPHLSGYKDFNIYHGADLVRSYRGTASEVGGALSVFDKYPSVELFSAYGACLITSGGTLSKEAWEQIAYEFLESIRQAPPVDGVYFSMHGAMASEVELDPEGYLIEETRKILGEDIPIVVSLDLHGIATHRMYEQSDALVAFHTYPHVDFFQTGQRAGRLLIRILAEKVKPVSARVAIPALVRGDELITETGAIRKTMEHAIHLETSLNVLSAGLFIGNPFTDVPELQSYSFVVASGDSDLAAREALRMANQFWEDHEKMRAELVGLDEAMQFLKAERGGTVALVDAADATSSGASGDSNILLKKLIKIGYTGRVLLPLVDPQAVNAASAAGIGGIFQAKLGGYFDSARFQPLTLKVKVRMLSDGIFRSESFGGEWYSGPTAVLESGNYTLVVSSRPVHLFDRSFFYAHGQNPRHFDAVVVKSPHCQPHMYADWCARMIHIDIPGSTSANLSSLGHIHCPRPIFPLDTEVPFNPDVTLYSRLKYYK